MDSIFQSHYIKVIPYLLEGLWYTVLITSIGLLFGFILGIAIGFGKLSKNKILYVIANIYVELIRGTPLLIQVLFIYFALPDLIGIYIERVPAAILAISINSAAYVAEIVRGSVESINKGQMEAGRSIGLTYAQTMRYVIWPQAFKHMLPSLGNQFIISLKDTSLFSVIAVKEFLFQARIYYSSTFAVFEALTMVSLIYLIITVPASMYLKRLEGRLEAND